MLTLLQTFLYLWFKQGLNDNNPGLNLICPAWKKIILEESFIHLYMVHIDHIENSNVCVCVFI